MYLLEISARSNRNNWLGPSAGLRELHDDFD